MAKAQKSKMADHVFFCSVDGMAPLCVELWNF